MNDEKWISLAIAAKSDASCIRRQVGAVLVKDDTLLTYGSNRPTKGVDDCTEDTCIRHINKIPSGTRAELCMAVHAEQNALFDAFNEGLDVHGSTIYVSDSPCVICAKFIIASGVKRVVYYGKYPDELAINLFKLADIEVCKYELPINKDVLDTQNDIYQEISRVKRMGRQYKL